MHLFQVFAQACHVYRSRAYEHEVLSCLYIISVGYLEVVCCSSILFARIRVLYKFSISIPEPFPLHILWNLEPFPLHLVGNYGTWNHFHFNILFKRNVHVLVPLVIKNWGACAPLAPLFCHLCPLLYLY